MPFWTVEDAGPYKEKLNFLMRTSPFAACFLFSENDLSLLLGRAVEGIQQFGAFENRIDVALGLDAAVDGAEEGLVLHAVHVGDLVIRLTIGQRLAVEGEELAAVGQTDTALVAQKVDKGFVFAGGQVLRPGAVEGDGGLIGADVAGDQIVYVVDSVLHILGILGPHALVAVGLHILGHLAVSVAGGGLQLSAAQ